MTISLVQDNPYRVLGVTTQIPGRIISSNYKKMMSESLKGKDINLALDMKTMMKPPLRTPRRLDQAKTQLLSARGRIYYSIFWFVDTSKHDHAAIYYLAHGQREKAIKILQSQQSFSSYINLAVLALIEDRFDDAATLYSRCLNDEEMTQAFVHAIIGDKFKIKGAFVLSRVLDALQHEKERKERDDNSDERSFAGAGHGIANKEAQASRTRLVNDPVRSRMVDAINLKKQAGSFDRHLNDALNNLIDRIADINQEAGIEDDFLEVELNPNPAAQMVLDEITRFLAVNNSLMEAFRQRCSEARERSLYLDYIYNLISVVHYALHLYAIELGRQFNSGISQQLRSMIAKLERLYFRLKSDDLDYFIASLRRIDDSLPFYHAVASNFEKYYMLSDDANLINNFYEFNKASRRVIEQFSMKLGLKGSYIDCSLHLQDMIVRYNVSFMLVLVNLALKHPYKVKSNHLNINYTDLRSDDTRVGYGLGDGDDMGPDGQDNGQNVGQNGGPPDTYYSERASRNLPVPVTSGQPDGDSEIKQKLTREEKKKLAEKEKERILKEKRRADYFKRKLTRYRSDFIDILNHYQAYSISPNTATLIEITMRQVKRLPPPVSVRGLTIGTLLILAAIGALYLNSLTGK